jgi:hypothetical protein
MKVIQLKRASFLTAWHDFVSFAELREELIDIRTIMRHYKLTPKQAPTAMTDQNLGCTS